MKRKKMVKFKKKEKKSINGKKSLGHINKNKIMNIIVNKYFNITYIHI